MPESKEVIEEARQLAQIKPLQEWTDEQKIAAFDRLHLICFALYQQKEDGCGDDEISDGKSWIFEVAMQETLSKSIFKGWNHLS